MTQGYRCISDDKSSQQPLERRLTAAPVPFRFLSLRARDISQFFRFTSKKLTSSADYVLR